MRILCILQWRLVFKKMSTVANDDVLQSLPFEKWHELRDTLTIDWPRFAHYFYLIDNAINWRKKDPTWLCNYFCPNADPYIGVFVVITPLPVYNVISFAFEKSKKLLYECLTTTNQIDWSRTVLLRCVDESNADIIEEAVDYLVKDKKLEVYCRESLKNYIKTKEDCRDIRIKIPEDLELRFFNDESCVRDIFNVWPHEEFKDDPQNSLNYLSAIIRLNGGIGLFTKKEDKLVAWALKNDWSGIGMVQTLEEYKRRGYAKIVINALSKTLANEGTDSAVMIALDNKASDSLFIKLGWSVTSSLIYVKLKPK